MPLFGKFTSKKTPPRKSTVIDTGRDLEEYEFLSDDNIIRLCLDEHEIVFEDGQWTTETEVGSESSKVNQKLRKEIQTLKEENNLLKLKFDILLDMFTERTVNQSQVINKLSNNKKLING